MFVRPWLIASFLLFVCLSVTSGTLAAEIPRELDGVRITEKLGQSVSLRALQFKDEAGNSVALSQYFSAKRPVLLTLAYYECASLCTFVLNGLVDTLKKIDWTPGTQFDVVTVSIDPTEGHELAQAKKASYLESYGRPAASAGWHFLTGSQAAIKQLADEVGFGYKYIPEEKQFAHGAAIFVLTPEGRISRYLYGIEYRPQDLRLALLEASDGRIGNVIDRLLLFCYRYNPHTRRYSMVLTRVMQAGCAGATVLVGLYLGIFWRRQRRLVLGTS